MIKSKIQDYELKKIRVSVFTNKNTILAVDNYCFTNKKTK